MSALSESMIAVLAAIRDTRVMVDNRGNIVSKGVRVQSVRAAQRHGLIVVNGASRSTHNGRSVRRLVLTGAGKSALSA